MNDFYTCDGCYLVFEHEPYTCTIARSGKWSKRIFCSKACLLKRVELWANAEEVEK